LAVLIREGVIAAPEAGMTLVLHSDVPLGAGVSSSAALEVASMSAMKLLLRFELEGLELARLCQIVENRIAGAPCGIMDQVTSALGNAHSLLAIRCQPHDVLGNRPLPKGWAVYGINSAVRHAVGGGKYAKARVGAFMGLRIINHDLGLKPRIRYLCNLTPEVYVDRIRGDLPPRLLGSEFAARYGETADAVTKVQPEVTYSVRGCTEHPIYENARVEEFMALMEDGSRRAAVLAGKLMYGSHWSYGNRAGLGCPETDLIVRLVKERGIDSGLMGAKITGGGSGGTVAVLTYGDAAAAVSGVAEEYAGQTGIAPQVFSGSSPGAMSWEG
jgi:L-arabinokinase